MEIEIRRAQERDIPDLHRMLLETAAFHGAKRPDIFKSGAAKYSTEELTALLTQNNEYTIFAAQAEEKVCGYVFCILQTVRDHPLLQDRRELYVDDLFVDREYRSNGIARLLMQQAQAFAKQENCDCVTLNVWNFPETARGFYEKAGYTERKRYMELPL